MIIQLNLYRQRSSCGFYSVGSPRWSDRRNAEVTCQVHSGLKQGDGRKHLHILRDTQTQAHSFTKKGKPKVIFTGSALHRTDCALTGQRAPQQYKASFMILKISSSWRGCSMVNWVGNTSAVRGIFRMPIITILSLFTLKMNIHTLPSPNAAMWGEMEFDQQTTALSE